MFLTDDQIVQLTKRTQHRAQSNVLNALGIDHKQRPDGTLVVLSSHVEKVLDSTLATAKLKAKKNEPDWAMI